MIQLPTVQEILAAFERAEPPVLKYSQEIKLLQVQLCYTSSRSLYSVRAFAMGEGVGIEAVGQPAWVQLIETHTGHDPTIAAQFERRISECLEAYGKKLGAPVTTIVIYGA